MRIVLAVEDIDRCNEDKIIQNIDALRVLLEDTEIAKRVLIVTAIDERILKNAILIKYRSVLDTRKTYAKKTNNSDHDEHHDLISEYLDKLFISAIKLGDLSNNQVKEYMLQLIKNEMYNNKGSVGQQAAPQTTTGAETTTTSKLYLSAPDVPNPLSASSTPPATDSSHTHIPPSNLKTLTQAEFSCLDIFFGKWINPTPRKMRIFYYRYLLSKNQLIGKYDVMQRPNIWQYPSGISTIMGLIHFYSQAGNLELLTKDRRETWENPNEVVSIPNTSANRTVPRIDLEFY